MRAHFFFLSHDLMFHINLSTYIWSYYFWSLNWTYLYSQITWNSLPLSYCLWNKCKLQSVITIDVYEGERASTTGNNKLGTFDLTGIPPAPRGTPAILVTFSLVILSTIHLELKYSLPFQDANGILTVTAKDKATGNQNMITIRNNRGRLDQQTIDRMIRVSDGIIFTYDFELGSRNTINILVNIFRKCCC